MIVLDTQHVSQLQLRGSEGESKLSAKLRPIAGEARISIISPYEQIKESLGRINASGAQLSVQVGHFAVLARLLDYYALWRGRILPFDEAAAQIQRGFSTQLVRRIGARDSRIAAIVLAHGATLLSSNLRDFQLVPGLRVEDWVRE